jgi:glycosyltransferase involved in cell wall biosynthesis
MTRAAANVSDPDRPIQIRPVATRVLWISHYPVFGGPHNIPLRLAPLLRETGIETVMMLPDEPGSAAERMIDAGVRVITLPLHRLRRTRDPRVHATFVRQARNEIAAIRRMIRDGGYDIVVLTGLTNPHGAIAARLERTPIAWQILDSANPPYVREPSMTLVRRWADAVLFTGRTVERMHTRFRPLRQPSVLFTPPVDTERYRPITGAERAAIRAELGVPPEAPFVGTVANLNPMKGIEWFIRAAVRIYARCPDTWFLISGASYPQHSDYLEALRREIRESPVPAERWKLRVCHDPRLDRLYPALDVKLITSVPASEGHPTTASETLACGVPVVTTDVGGVREVVQDGVSGFVVAPRDAETLAAATLRLLDNPPLRARMGQAARARAVEHCSLPSCAKVYAGVFEELTAADRRMRP